jgi:hypothetical protein
VKTRFACHYESSIELWEEQSSQVFELSKEPKVTVAGVLFDMAKHCMSQKDNYLQTAILFLMCYLNNAGWFQPYN